MARMASSDWLTSRGASWLCSKTSPATTTNSAPVSAASAPRPGDHVAARGRIPWLRLAVQEVAGHAELPVGGVQEAHVGPPFRSYLVAGMASVGPGSDKSRDLDRHVRATFRSGAARTYRGWMSARYRTLLLLRHAKSDYPRRRGRP